MKTQRGISLYWRCQLIGWTAASLYWAYTGIAAPGSSLVMAGWLLVSDVALYILITHLYRKFSLRRKWQYLGLKPLLLRLVPSVLVLCAAYTVVTLLKIYALRMVFMPGMTQPLASFVSQNMIGVANGGIRLMAIWLLAYHGYHYALREMRVIQENAGLQLALKEAQLQNVYAQINPHFLFNSLNTIKALVNTQPSSARRGIDLLSELLRTSLYESEQQETTVATELALVKDYIELEQLRMEDRLQCSISIEETLLLRQVPRLSLITMVENAVKHGIAQHKDGGVLSIVGKTIERGSLFTVTHPGILGDGEGIGLQNLKERLAALYYGKGFFRISSENEMVSAQLFIPR